MCFVVELALARPNWQAMLGGVAPDGDLLRDAGMVWLAAGILGATVMPHNLYLHSTLVNRHAPDGDDASIANALRRVNYDTFGSLSFAFVINAALLAVSLFGPRGSNQLLVASQVVPCLQLPLAVLPLVRKASRARRMGSPGA